MIKIENTVTPSAAQWMSIIMGARNPMNSWDKSDSKIIASTLAPRELAPGVEALEYEPCEPYISIGENDHELLMRLAKNGSDHSKYRRMVVVYADITAPLYLWKEFDTYKVGTVANSCSTMHKIHEKEFVYDDFSTDQLNYRSWDVFEEILDELNYNREKYLKMDRLAKEGDQSAANLKKDYWWQMIQLLPTSYNQKRTVMLNYEVLANIYKSRKNHKLDEWRELCKWIEQLPYSELITLNNN